MVLIEREDILDAINDVIQKQMANISQNRKSKTSAKKLLGKTVQLSVAVEYTNYISAEG